MYPVVNNQHNRQEHSNVRSFIECPVTYKKEEEQEWQLLIAVA